MGLIKAMRELIFGEIPEYSVGDWVKCIDDVIPNNWYKKEIPVKFGEAYQILNMAACKKCGKVMLDVGKKHKQSHTKNQCNCYQIYGSTIFPGAGINWVEAKRFVKIKKKEALLIINSSQESQTELPPVFPHDTSQNPIQD